ncbi:MAG: OB-fold nucleic acid binding domain-containing protein, partial [Propionibacterium sp.]|nr:OB-fold nucleic acid binding domain-containing protein [Propionibacterium sp.]
AHEFFEFLDNVPLSVCNKRCIESLIKAGAFDSMGHSRRALMDVFETAVDGVIDLKRNQANGQDDLFGDLGGGDAESDPAMNHTVPDIPDWDKRTKLAFEREMLGLYVSDHPLRGLEHVLSAERTIGLGQIAEQGAEADGHVEVICGMITQVQRKQTKKGAFWAIIDVEDLDASMQVLIFPKVYETCLTQLSPDTIVRIRGRVVNKDESLEMQADELTLPDIRQSSGGPVTIRLPLVRCTPPIVAELRQVLTAHPGSTEVRVQLVGPQSDTVLRVGDGLRVTNEQPLVADLKALLGPASVAV